jgi:hypothetical protein
MFFRDTQRQIVFREARVPMSGWASERAPVGNALALPEVRAWLRRERKTARWDLLTEEGTMLWTLVVILIVLWLLGLVSSYTMGGLIHVLLVIAIVVILLRVIQGRRVG